MIRGRPSDRRAPIVIIGGGPAGLALAYQLRKRRLDSLILDGGGVGSSWERMPRRLKLVSPWNCNYLADSDRNRFPAGHELGRAEFLAYLHSFAARHDLPVATGCRVNSVRRVNGRFVLETAVDTTIADIVVNATGYFSKPVFPIIPGEEETAIPRIHYAHHVHAEAIRARGGNGGKVLIVGSRLSAGQLALDLFDAGMSVHISHRTPIRFGVGDRLWPIVRRTFMYAEAVRLRVRPQRNAPLDVPMQGGRVRKLIKSGAIFTVPAISRFEKDSVVLESGIRLKPSVIVFATGFAPALDHLGGLDIKIDSATGRPFTRNMESISTPGLYFLGLEMLRNFQSRFLRGIRNDALALATILEDQMQQVILATSQPPRS